MASLLEISEWGVLLHQWDSAGFPPGLYKVDCYAIFGAIALLGGYGIFAAAAQLTTEWGPAWGGIFAPQAGGEYNVRKSFYVNLT